MSAEASTSTPAPSVSSPGRTTPSGIIPNSGGPQPYAPVLNIAANAVHNVRAAIRAKSEAAAGQTPGITPNVDPAATGSTESPAESSTPAVDETKPEHKALREVARLSKQNRDLANKVKEFETSTADFQALKEARDLYKTDPITALGKLAGADPTAEMDRLVKLYFGATDPEAKAEAGDDLAAKVDQISKKIEADEAQRRAEADTKTKADAEIAAKAVDAQIEKQVGSILDSLVVPETSASRFPLSSKPENRSEATRYAAAIASKLQVGRGIPDDTTDEAIISGLFAEAFEIVEAEYIELGKRFSIDKTTPTDKAAVDPPANGKTTEKAAAVPAQKSLTLTTRPVVQLNPTKEVMSRKEAAEKARADIAAIYRNRAGK